jgi:hypothetical protein
MKIQCSCGAKYAFDLTPEMAREPIKFVCPQCGLDSSELVNQLIQQELAEQNLPPAPPPPSAPASVPKPMPARLKISHTEKTAEAPPVESGVAPVAYTSKYCPRHSGVLATEKCATCGKPICPQCLEVFGYFCSALCKGKAELQGIIAPQYSGRLAAEKQFWRKTGLIFGSLVTVLILALGFWIWYAWFGSVPHTFFSASFADDDRAYAGGAQLVGPDQIVFLHGSTLARYDLKTKDKIWSQELITPDQIAAVVKEEDEARAQANQNSDDGTYANVPLPGAEERRAKIALQNELSLRVSSTDVWVAAPGKLTHYDWDTGKVLQVTPLTADTVTARDSDGGGLLSTDGKPLDPNKVTEQAQNLTLPARIALPVLVANASHEQQLEAALRDSDGNTHRRPQNPAAPPGEADNTMLIPGQDGYVQFRVKILQQNIVTREAMRAASKKSVLNNSNLTIADTADVANETLNEMQRNNGGDTVSEDDSRYQVTVHMPNSTGIPDWTDEVVGPPELHVLKTVNVIAAGKTVIVLDKSNKKLWDTTLTYNVATGHGLEKSQFGDGPCVEHDGMLFVFDQAVLSAFDLTTGNARWRLPSVGVVGLFFDDQNNLYVNTTTGNPDDIKYSRQIDINKSTAAVLLKIEAATGKILWRTTPGGFVSYLSGKFIYAVQSYDPNPTDQEVLTDSVIDLQKPAYLRIVRIDPKDGRILWDHEQDRCPVAMQFDQNSIELIFKREVQVLKYLVL